MFPIKKYKNNPRRSFDVVIKGPVAKAGSIFNLSRIRGIRVPVTAARIIMVISAKLTVVIIF
jgi:hypothetical protein